MKKLVVVVLVALAVWLGVNYMRTGQLSLSPSTLSSAQQRVQDLESELKAVQSQIDQAGRAAGMTGMDTTGDVSALMTKKAKIEKELAAARSQQH